MYRLQVVLEWKVVVEVRQLEVEAAVELQMLLLEVAAVEGAVELRRHLEVEVAGVRLRLVSEPLAGPSPHLNAQKSNIT